MSFETPLALILLLVLPLAAWMAWPGRGPGRRREIISLLLRLLILLCLVLSLAGLNLVSRVDRLAVVFLLDRSDSVPPSAQAAEVIYVRQALKNMGPDDLAAVVAFGADALVERPMSSARELGEIASRPHSGQTDVAAAVQLGMSLFPAHTARRIVLLSDGASTVGDPQAAARLAAASGIEIDSLAVGSPPPVEALVTGLDAPQYLQQGERFDLQISLHATRAMSMTVRVLADGQLVYSGAQTLQAGDQSFSLSLQAGKTGFIRYQVQIEPQQDTYFQNNSLDTFVQVAGPPRVLVVAAPEGEPVGLKSEPRPPEAAKLVQALQAAHFEVEQVLPAGLPADLVGLAPYAAVVLVDVPARELNQAQMLSVQSYVRDLGGGLLAVGGPTSYGVGGYFHTPLEETLPVEMQLKDQKRRPSLAMVFIIDHSGSMIETSGGATKLALAKEAALRSVELLYPTDRVGVIDFDDAASWVVPMTDLNNPAGVQNAISTIGEGGGTDILAGLQAMAKVLPGDPASVKHVILLTDGGADPTGIPELVQRLHDQNGITLTTVGVGSDAASYLQRLAELGGGRYHFAADPGSIPSIFTEETSLVARSYIVEHAFYPAQSSASPILSGIRAVPQLQGYVAAMAKDSAQKILVSDEGDPILASWQYGLGRAVAFTSDATGRWAQAWLGWNQFASFWAQAVRSTIRDRAPSALDVRVIPASDLASDLASGDGQANAARIVVDAQSADGQSQNLNGYRLSLRVADPDGSVQSLELAQSAPGEYSAPFVLNQPGAYLIGVNALPPQGAASQQALAETAGYVLSYSEEYRKLDGDVRVLQDVARLANGRLLSLDAQGSEVFRHDLPVGSDSHPVWPWLLMCAAVLLPLDIAVRRLLLSPADLRRWLTRRRAAPQSSAARPRSERMDALFQAKQRASELSENSKQIEPPLPDLEIPDLQNDPSTPLQQGEKPGGDVETPPGFSEKKSRGPGGESPTVTSLLQAKRGRRK
jgi:Mg-chelatase subunit ChlD